MGHAMRKRADSRAHTPCPHCDKRLHGEKGLKQHIEQVHVEPAAAFGSDDEAGSGVSVEEMPA